MYRRFCRRNIFAQAHCAFTLVVLTGKKPNSAAISDDISDAFSKPIIHRWLKIIGINTLLSSLRPVWHLCTVEAILSSDRNQRHVTVTVSHVTVTVSFFYVPAVFNFNLQPATCKTRSAKHTCR